MDRHRRIPPPLLVLGALLLSTAAAPSLAQRSTNATSPQQSDHRSSAATTGGFTLTTAIVLVALVAAFFVLTFFSIYIKRRASPPPPRPRASPSPDSHHHHQDADAVRGDHRRARGLDKELVESFPTAVYGDVKKARVAAAALECAVCLAEFEDRDELRVLPACCHVFHPGCIDPWLAAAVTCPLCRADLTAPPPAETSRQQPETEAAVREEPAEQEEDDDDDEACLVAAAASFTPESVTGFACAAARPPHHELHYRRTQSAMDAPDRHTLRLPEHVMKELAAVRSHRRAASLAGYPDAAADRTPTPGWLASFWRSVSWQRQSRADADAAADERHGGTKRVVPITEGTAQERPGGSGSSGGDEKLNPDVAADALNRV